MEDIDIKKFRKDIGMTQEQLARKLGMSVSALQKWEAGGKIPQTKYDMILNLVSGNSPLKDSNNSNYQEENIESDKIPMLPIEAVAGRAIGYAMGVTLSDCRFIDNPIPGAELAIQVSGDSMLPEITPGTILYIKKILSKTFIPWGHTVVLDTRDGSLVKRIYPSDETEEYIIAKSTNPDYPPYKVYTEDIIGIYRILGTTHINSTL